jgi:hypothetical protein
MKKIAILIIIAMSCGILSQVKAQTAASKKIFTFSYDNAGNRIKRVYTLATGCIANPANCRTKPNDSLKQKALDSLFAIAQDIEIKLPENPTEKLIYDGSVELKNIYPNPTKGNFIIQFTNLVLQGSLLIVDIHGNKLDEIALDGTEFQIDISLFPAGEYILYIRTKDGKTYNKKIVKI